MEENKNISCSLCGKNTVKRIWYLDKCICDECAKRIYETVDCKQNNSPEIVDYVYDYSDEQNNLHDEFSETIYMKNSNDEFTFNALIAVISGFAGYYCSKKIYNILIKENISFNFRITLLILISLIPIAAVYLLFSYRKNKKNSMDNDHEKYSKKCSCKVCIKANEYEKSKNICDNCIMKSSFEFYSIYIALCAFSFGIWVYIAGFIDLLCLLN